MDDTSPTPEPEKDPPPRRPACLREDALAVVRRLRDAGHVAYFAGGCVRDLLMGLEPKDYDVATDAPPDRVRRLFSNTQAVGAAFGVILVRHRGSVVEVATFRADGRYDDGRRPTEVRFTTAEEDAKRRDFTVNGLFLDPLDGDRVIDFVGGQEDIKARRLRAIGNPDERFEEDHLRLLRAVRFAARFGLEIEPATGAAIRAHAQQLKRISPERIAEELRLMLTPATRGAAWQLAWEYGLVREVMRFLTAPPHDRFDPDRSIVGALAAGRTTTFGTALAAAVLCYRWQAQRPDSLPFDVLDLGLVVHAAKATRQALRISNDELNEMTGTLKDLSVLLQGDRPRVATLKRFLAGATAQSTREIMAAVESIPGYDWRRVSSVRVELNRLAKTDCAPEPLITGDDLTAAGLKPGPVFKRTLDAVYDAQLEGKVSTRDEALALALRLAAADRGSS